jgi:hypothetical protein
MEEVKWRCMTKERINKNDGKEILQKGGKEIKVRTLYEVWD